MLYLEKKNAVIKIAWIVILFIVASLGCQSENFRGNKMPEDIQTADFTLTDQNGKPFTLSNQKGNVVLMFFGYTYCPDVCPMTLSTWMQVQDTLGNQAQKVKFVYITVDPERDTPERLKNHLKIYSPDFIGLTGSQGALDSVYSSYGVYHDRNDVEGSDGIYFMSHTSSTYVIDPNGEWRLLLPYGTSIGDIVHDVKLLLK